MIPQSVADSLRSGTDPVDTCQVINPGFKPECESHDGHLSKAYSKSNNCVLFWLSHPKAFESITVLFVELANVDEITATNAMEAVSCMNAVFSCFDNTIDQHSVYKV